VLRVVLREAAEADHEVGVDIVVLHAGEVTALEEDLALRLDIRAIDDIDVTERNLGQRLVVIDQLASDDAVGDRELALVDLERNRTGRLGRPGVGRQVDDVRLRRIVGYVLGVVPQQLDGGSAERGIDRVLELGEVRRILVALRELDDLRNDLVRGHHVHLGLDAGRDRAVDGEEVGRSRLSGTLRLDALRDAVGAVADVHRLVGERREVEGVGLLAIQDVHEPLPHRGRAIVCVRPS